MAQNKIKAVYAAPGGQHELTLEISAPARGNVESKKTYLSNLRSSTKKLQEDINVFLTSKMEEDKHSDRREGFQDLNKNTNDEVEEANYGEEKVEDD